MLSVLSPGAGCGSAVYTHSPSHGAGGQMMILLGHEDTGDSSFNKKGRNSFGPLPRQRRWVISVSTYLYLIE